ncbi:MAG TPA: phenylalanine--tRNA ligase subunit alpha [Acidimicrobiales bacterium]|jgi:phenylalanyl-tRNA synthetase alpha chain|nr:phenylalanine--tRNA ligase subunit alpha [Acidimicrobiales bacterium]
MSPNPEAGSVATAGTADADLADIEAEALAGIVRAATLEELDEAERLGFGKRSRLAGRYQALRDLAPEERKEAGRILQEVRARLDEAAAGVRSELSAVERAARLAADKLDLSEVLPAPLAGHLHLVTQVREELEDVFVGMGYEIAEGPEAETDWYNFQALNIPLDHPARSSVDTFFLGAGEEEGVLLRTHTSPVQIRLLERGTLPIYAVAPGRVYRRDTPDATHLPVFHQIEGLVVDHGVTMGDLAGTIDTFVQAIFGANVRTRLRPAYFPFTEPSAEFEISCTICDGAGCRTCSHTGWIELGGCGMVNPAVFEATGVDPEEWTGFAFGFGIDRLAIMRHNIADLRSFIENDVRFLQQF